MLVLWVACVISCASEKLGPCARGSCSRVRISGWILFTHLGSLQQRKGRWTNSKRSCFLFAPSPVTYYLNMPSRICRHHRPNKSLDASGGSVFRNLLGTAEGALLRAAASTQT